jgi:hypothetical protein
MEDPVLRGVQCSEEDRKAQELPPREDMRVSHDG